MNLKQFDIMLHEAEVKLKRLKSLYEQWFQGIERLEPLVPRKDVERLFKTLQRDKPRNTAARFKLQTLHSRFQTYQTHWTRIARRIEEGTYERDLRKVRRRKKARRAKEQEPVKSFELDLNEEFDPNTLFAQDEISDVLTALGDGANKKKEGPDTAKRRALSAFSGLSDGSSYPPDLPGEDTAPNAINPFARPPATATFGRPKSNRPSPSRSAPAPGMPPAPGPSRPAPPAGRSRPAPPPPPGRSRPAPPPGRSRPAPPPPPRRAAPPPPNPDPMRRLYSEFTAARQKNNQKGALGYDKLAARVDKMRAKLRAKHGSKKIDFEVVVRDGKVGLKPKIR